MVLASQAPPATAVAGSVGVVRADDTTEENLYYIITDIVSSDSAKLRIDMRSILFMS